MRSSLTLLMLAMMLDACGLRRAPQVKIPRIGDHKTGEASWYGVPYHGRRAANGEIYDMEKLTAAHRTYAFDTWLRVVNLANDKSVVVRVNDRGPFAHNRIIDLSLAAAREIDMVQAGVTKVRLEVVRPPKTPPDQAAAHEQRTKQPTPSLPPGDSSGPSLPSLTKAPAEAPTPPARFTLQAGAFHEEANARVLLERLQTKFSFVSSYYDQKTQTWKVTVGAFATAAESAELASTLQDEGVDTFVVAVTP